ncbi:MAG: PorT family protein [Cytophagaceae bacterium]|nr:MAG: PorT family protein [Cytophagaceae bacterium]
MKSLLLSAALLAFAAATTTSQARARAAAPTDTIVVRLPNKAVLTLIVRDARQLRELPKYHLDSLVARLDGYIQRADEAAKTAKTDRVTLEFFPNQDQPGQGLPEQIRVTTRKKDNTNRMEVLLNRIPGVNVNLEPNGGKLSVGGKDSPDKQAERDSIRRAHRSTKSNFVVDVGLNTLVNRGAGAPDLRTLGSRYISLGLFATPRLGGAHSPLSLVFGPEFTFNNYMLEGNNKWINQNGRTSVVLETSGRQYQKTKLATSTLTLPLMFQLDLREKDPRTGRERTGFTLGAGGFVGYRLASWTKLKYFEDGNTHKDKDYSPYNLNDWQYGLQGLIGYHSLDFFVKYNLNELFRSGQGPQAQTLSFGIRFLAD